MMSLKAAGTPPIQLKGTNFGIRVVFSNSLSDDLLLESFEAIPEQAYALPMGTGVVLDFQSRSCSNRLAGDILSRVIWPKGLTVLAWVTSDDESAARLARGGFKTEEPVVERAKACTDTLIIDRSLRSGQHEDYSGNVVLAGHLNSGAELFAGGSVSILGKLNGLVHAGLNAGSNAGSNGTEGVYIIAGSFEPQQLRIGDKMYSKIGTDMKWWKKPVIITLGEEGLFFRDWKLETG